MSREDVIADSLTLEEAIPFLLERRLLETRHLFDDDVSAGEVGGLNTNVCVITQHGPSYFLKQHRGAGPRARSRALVETELYRRVAQDEWAARLSPFLPRFHLADPGRGLLVLEYVASGPLVEDEPDADDALRDSDGPSGQLGIPAFAGYLAEALAAAHGIPADPDLPPAELAFLPRETPWALAIARPVPDMLSDLSPAQLELLRLIQADERICAVLDERRQGWQPTRLIHGDLKWSNIVPVTAGESQKPIGVRLVDWELAKIGDPAWDVGSVFHSYLARSVAATRVEELSVDEATAAMAAHFARAQQELRRFWHAYSRAAILDESSVAGFLDRAVPFCGARLLQSAYEWSQGGRRLSRSALSLLQLGINFLRKPSEAGAVVLGLTQAGAA